MRWLSLFERKSLVRAFEPPLTFRVNVATDIKPLLFEQMLFISE